MAIIKSDAGQLRLFAQASTLPLPDLEAVPQPHAKTLTPAREVLALALCIVLLVMPTVYSLPMARIAFDVVSVCTPDLSSCLLAPVDEWDYWHRATMRWQAYSDEPRPCIKTECPGYTIWRELLDRDL